MCAFDLCVCAVVFLCVCSFALCVRVCLQFCFMCAFDLCSRNLVLCVCVRVCACVCCVGAFGAAIVDGIDLAEV